MTKTLFAVALLLPACATNHPACECADQEAALIAHVDDAVTDAPIAQPTFTEAGAPLGATCTEQIAGSPCKTWTIPMVGPHDVTISATGYGAQTIHVDLAQGAGGCCSQGQQLVQTVSLTPSP